MKDLAASTDPGYAPAVNPTRFQQLLRQYLQDERDLPFAALTLQITLAVLPLAVALYVPALAGGWWWAAAGLYFFLGTFYFKGPFGLMLHCTSHRVLFRKQYGWANKYIPWVIGPFFGQTPDTYFTHHLGMHHPENNLPDDESSTMFYQRDSLRGFLHYLADFVVLGAVRLIGYFNRRNKPTLRLRFLRGEISYAVVVLGLAYINLPATLVVFLLPLLSTRIVMMLGNWSQHAFIDGNEPENCYTNSITCINTAYNHACWNDGYHISHHIKPTMHWTEHPAHFRKNLPQYAAHDAIVFDGIHFLHVFAYLMAKRYDLLARHFVYLGGPARSEEEVVAFLRRRTQRIARPPVLAMA